MAAAPSLTPSINRTKEWHACCREIILGRNPKRQRLHPHVYDDDENEDHPPTDTHASSGYLAIDLRPASSSTTSQPSISDAWLSTALAMSSSIDDVSATISSQSTTYANSDTLHICFSSRHYETTSADRSLLETTVASFAAGMAKQIDSLREAVTVADEEEWATGPVGHRTGIASCLMTRLKLEVMEPMTKLTLEREEKFKNGEDAVRIAEEPTLGFDCRGGGERPMPPAPWEMGEHNDESERREREEEYVEFINVYGRENEREDDLVQSLNSLKNNTMPPLAVMQCLDFPERTSQQYTTNTTNAIQKPHQEQQSSLFSLRSKQPIQTNDYLLDNTENETQQLQRESAALLCTYQQSDLDTVQKVERSMVEITQLLSRFTDLISEQQEDILSIHDKALKSKENVDRGQEELVDAAKRGEGSRHPMAVFIVCMALTLLFLNWILP
jgi:hypothetical protein